MQQACGIGAVIARATGTNTPASSRTSISLAVRRCIKESGKIPHNYSDDRKKNRLARSRTQVSQLAATRNLSHEVLGRARLSESVSQLTFVVRGGTNCASAAQRRHSFAQRRSAGKVEVEQNRVPSGTALQFRHRLFSRAAQSPNNDRASSPEGRFHFISTHWPPSVKRMTKFITTNIRS